MFTLCLLASEVHKEGRRTTGRGAEGWGSLAEEAYCRLSKVRVLKLIPDPGALNSCMHTCPNEMLD